MIFQHTLDKVLDGTKTQTRRIVKANHNITHIRYSWNEKIISVGTMNRDLYSVGSTYAVQGGRGQKGVARILITSISKEDVRNISDDDVKAEGFASRDEFLTVWESMHSDQYQAWVITFKLVGGES